MQTDETNSHSKDLSRTPSIESKPPQTLSNLKWVWDCWKHGSFKGRALAIAALLILVFSALGVILKWPLTDIYKYIAPASTSGPQDPKPNATLKEASTKLPPSAPIDSLKECRSNFDSVYFHTSKNTASNKAFQQAITIINEIDRVSDLLTYGKYQDRAFTKLTESESWSANYDLSLETSKLRNCITTIKPELTKLSKALTILEDTIIYSAENPNYLGEYHASLAAHLEDIERALKSLKHLDELAKASPDTSRKINLSVPQLENLPNLIPTLIETINNVIIKLELKNNTEQADHNNASRLATQQPHSTSDLELDPIELRSSELMKKGIAADKRGETNLAIRSYIGAIEINGKANDARLYLVNAYLSKGQITEAQAEASVLIENDPQSFRGHYAMALCFKAKKDYSTALIHQKEALEKAPMSTTMSLGYAELLRETGKYDEAISIYKSITTPKNLDVTLGLANSYWHKSDHKNAEIAFRKAIELSPKSPDIYRGLSEVIKTQNPKGAIDAMLTALKLDPENSSYGLLLAELYQSQKDYENASKFYQIAINLDAQNADAYDGLARVMDQLSKDEQAIISARKALSINPLHTNARLLLSSLLLQDKKLNEGILILKDGIEKKPNVAEFHANLAMFYYNQGKLDDASNSAQLAISINPKHAFAHYTMGLIHEAKKSQQAAIDSYQLAINFDPNKPSYRYALGAYFSKIKRYNESVVQLEKAVELDPKNNTYTDALVASTKRSKK